MVFRHSVTFETPGHAKRLHMGDLMHLIHLTVTTDAADATIHVNGVIKENIIR